MNEHEYIIDAFTKDGANTNLEVNNLNVGCITSKNNNFEIDSDGNLVAKTISLESITPILNAIYPVGAIYISTNDINPSTIFGGTWEQIKDKFLLSCGDYYTNGSMGGEATHVLTTEELPSHTHSASTNTTGNHRHTYAGWWTTNGAGSVQYACVARGDSGDSPEYGTFSTAGNHSHTVTINNTGNGQAHNNMPPYLAVYMWKRIS